MMKKYRVVGIHPLSFPDGQEAETGEEFERDFAATSGENHEQWLIQTNHIALVVPPEEVTKTPTGPKSKPAKTEKEV